MNYCKGCCSCCVGCYSCMKSLIFPPKIHSLNVTDDPKNPKYGVGFSESIFQPGEFKYLKAFCNKNKIFQSDLNLLFNIYLTSEEVYLREFRVSTSDTKRHFERTNETLLTFEMGDIILPALFSKPHDVLPPPETYEEVTFTRFIIISYTFCMQPISDLLFDFFALLRQNFSLKLNAVIYSYNLEQLLLVITEELKISAPLRYVIKKCNIANDNELTIETIVQYGVKYPVMFYPLERFRKHFKRVIFGDKFWQGKKILKTKFLDNFGHLRKSEASINGFVNEKSAVKETARAIISDFYTEGIKYLERRKRKEYEEKEAKLLEQKYSETEGEENELFGDMDNNNLRTSFSNSLNSDSNDGASSILKRKSSPSKYSVKPSRLVELPKILLSTTPRIYTLEAIDKFTCELLKSECGYKLAREIIRDSELELEESQLFFSNSEPTDEEDRIFDKQVQREFIYNVATGTRSWIESYLDQEEDILRETYHRTSHNM